MQVGGRDGQRAGVAQDFQRHRVIGLAQRNRPVGLPQIPAQSRIGGHDNSQGPGPKALSKYAGGAPLTRASLRFGGHQFLQRRRTGNQHRRGKVLPPAFGLLQTRHRRGGKRHRGYSINRIGRHDQQLIAFHRRVYRRQVRQGNRPGQGINNLHRADFSPRAS